MQQKTRSLERQDLVEETAVSCRHLQFQSRRSNHRDIHKCAAVFVLVEARLGSVQNDVDVGDVIASTDGYGIALQGEIERRFVLFPKFRRAGKGNLKKER